MNSAWTHYGSSRGSSATISGIRYTIRGLYNRTGQCYEVYRQIEGSFGSVWVGMYRTIGEARAAAQADAQGH